MQARRSSFRYRRVLAAVAAAAFCWGATIQLRAVRGDVLESGFETPPQSAGIRCWWWWLNGNVTKEAITRDLREMKAKGFSGVCIFDAGGAEERGNNPVPAGPMFGSPEWRELFRHAVQESERLGLVLSLNIQSGWNLGGPDVTAADATKHLTWSETRVKSGERMSAPLAAPKSRDGFYRDIAVLAIPAKAQAPGGGAQRPGVDHLRDKSAFDELHNSAPDARYLLQERPVVPGEEDAKLAEIIDLTSRLRPDGTLDWEAPAGEWVVLRFGYTYSGATVAFSSGKWQGRVLDHMSEAAFRGYWRRNVEPLLQEIRPQVGKTLKYLQTDSWELGGINWTDGFAEEFRRRCGYDVIPYLPVIAGRIIENRDVCTRFLADFRKTIGDCISDNHYAIFARLAAEHGLGIQPESAGPHGAPLDGIKNYGHSEIMMSEFWVPSPHRPSPERRFFVKQAASAAHVHNRRLVGAESFTSIGPHWDDTLWKAHKPSFDHEICSGLNLVLVHTFTCSPKEMGLPGQEYFAGTHFNPQVTWWDMAGEFVRYLSRCQFMMQQGTFVADTLYYYGDHVPNIARLKEDDPARVLPGYDYDIVDEDTLLTLQVKNARVTLPHGMSYRILALPNHKILSLAALRKVHALVRAGAVVVGPRTQRTASLVQYPASEAEVQRLSTELWGDADTARGSHACGKGRVFWGMTAREALTELGVGPDFEPVSPDSDATFDYIHHTLDGMHYYFVCNQKESPRRLEASFRVTGLQPELWWPLTGERSVARAFRQEGGRTIVPIEFGTYGSVFVIFRGKIPTDQSGTASSNARRVEPLASIEGPWDARFDPAWGGPELARFERLVSWTERPEPGLRLYSGKGTYSTTFEYKPAEEPGGRILLELGDVRDVGIARVRLNGKDCGITWTPPFRVEVTAAIRSGKNLLEVEVVNSWRNRLVGDRDLPPEQRRTRTNITIRPEWTVLPSGLLGPVRLLRSE